MVRQSILKVLVLAMLAVWPAWLAPAASPSRENAAVLLVEHMGQRCAYRFHFPSRGAVEDWFDLPDCLAAPENLVFEPDKNRAIFLRAGQYWTVDLRSGAKPASLAPAYPVEKAWDVYESKTWIDKRTGALRVAYLIALPTDSAGNPTGGWVRTLLPGLAEPWSKNQAGPGTPAVALVAELQKDGSWKRLAAKPTGTDTEDSLGLDPIHPLLSPKPGMVSLRDLLMAATCHMQDCVSKIVQLGKSSGSWARKLFGAWRQGDNPTFDYIVMGSGDGLVGAVVQGDTFHWQTPIFYCVAGGAERCAARKELPFGKEKQKGISVKAGFALITEEYEGTSAYLYKSGSDKPVMIYKPDTVAAWMSFSPW